MVRWELIKDDADWYVYFNNHLAGMIKEKQLPIWKTFVSDFERLAEIEKSPSQRDCLKNSAVWGNLFVFYDRLRWWNDYV